MLIFNQLIQLILKTELLSKSVYDRRRSESKQNVLISDFKIDSTNDLKTSKKLHFSWFQFSE